MLLDRLERTASSQVEASEIEQLLHLAESQGADDLQLRSVVLLSELYPLFAPKYPELARRTHRLLLRGLKEPRRTFGHPACGRLLVTHLREGNLEDIPWRSTDEVVVAAECFYGAFAPGVAAEDTHRRVRDLVKFAGLQFVKDGRPEEAFRLLSQVPVPSSVMDADLFRLRSMLLLYEQRRVKRVRRWLFTTIGAVMAFVFLASPIIFQAVERQARETLGIPPLSYFDATYWSVITFATVGYGDVVPHTIGGKMLALVNCLSGVTVLGVVAGLLLSYVTARELPS